MIARSGAFTLTLLISVGCSPEPADSGPEEVFDSVPTLVLSSQPLFTVGTADGSEDQQLYRVSGAYLREDGGIVIANSGTRAIRAYNESGNLSWSTGREGGGPGEFRGIRSASRMRGDSTVVWDPPQRRLTYIGPGGNVGAVVQVESALTIPLSGDSVSAFPTAMNILTNGTAVAEPGFLTQVMSRGPDGIRRDTVPLFVFGRDGSLAASIGPIAGAETFVDAGSSMLMPFGHRLLIAAVGQQVFVGTGKGPIAVYDSDGVITRSIDLQIDPIPISDADFEAMKQRWLARMTPQSRESMAETLADLPRMDHHPLYSRLAGGSDDRLWVQLYSQRSDSLQHWVALSGEGRVITLLAVPTAYQVLDIRQDRLAILRRDELDTEQVAVFALQVGR